MTLVAQSYQNIAIIINNDNMTVIFVMMLCCISNSLINKALGNYDNGTKKMKNAVSYITTGIYYFL